MPAAYRARISALRSTFLGVLGDSGVEEVGEPGYSRFTSAKTASSKVKIKLPSALKACGSQCPIGDSNPCFRLERAMSWAARRMGLHGASHCTSPLPCRQAVIRRFPNHQADSLTSQRISHRPRAFLVRRANNRGSYTMRRFSRRYPQLAGHYSGAAVSGAGMASTLSTRCPSMSTTSKR